MPTSRAEGWDTDAEIPVDVELGSLEEPAADDPTRTPSLARPFAAFGAAAGFFAILALGSFRDAAREVSPITPMLATALFAALAGVALRRWLCLSGRALAREAVIIRVGVISAVAGAASGGTVGLVTWGFDGFVRFAGGGAIVGLVFVPSCLVVFDAASRAGRGRHGSLVAATDRRTVLSTVLAGIAFAGATQVPALLDAEISDSLDPIVQAGLSIAVCLGAVIAIVVLQRRDRRARAELEAFERDAQWLDRAGEDEEAGADAAPVDLGIGAEQWTKSAEAYRKSGRKEVLVKGSIASATAAFDECVRRRHRSLIVAACSLTAVALSFVLRLSVLLP